MNMLTTALLLLVGQDPWRPLPDLVEGFQQYMGGGAVDGTLFAFGGDDPVAPMTGGKGNWALRPGDASPAWSSRAAMPVGLKGMAVATVGGLIYSMGGTMDGSTPTTHVLVYDPASDLWHSGAAPMPLAREMAAGAAANGRIYVIGGYDPLLYISKTVQEYDPSTNAWRTMADLPFGLTDHCAAGVNGRIYVCGGMTEVFDEMPGSRGNGSPATFEFNPAAGPIGTWTRKANLPESCLYGIYGAGAASIGASVFVLGGATYDGFSPYTGALEYRTDLDEWTELPNNPKWNYFVPVVASGGKAYQLVATMEYSPAVTLPAGSAPAEPSRLRQLDPSGIPIPTGARIESGAVSFRAELPDHPRPVRLEVEVVSASSFYSGLPVASSQSGSGGSHEARFSPSTAQACKWRARTQDDLGQSSSWVIFGLPGADPDFLYGPASEEGGGPPPASDGSGRSGGGCGNCSGGRGFGPLILAALLLIRLR